MRKKARLSSESKLRRARKSATSCVELPNVSKEPAPDVEVLQFTEFGPVLAVRPHTHNDHYWQVYFATTKAIIAVGAEAGYPPVERTLKMRQPGRPGKPRETLATRPGSGTGGGANPETFSGASTRGFG